MRRLAVSSLLLCLLAALAAAQPASVKTSPGEAVVLRSEGDKEVVWVNPDKKRVQLIEDSSGKKAVFVSRFAGDYEVPYVDPATKKTTYLTVAVVGLGPAPGPDDPKPKPDDPPRPLAALRVLVLIEEAEAAKLPAGQRAIVWGKTSYDALNAKTPLGPDGKTREWRIWDQDVNPGGDDKKWGAAIKRAKATKGYAVPWALFFDGEADAYSGPLPKSVAEWTALLDKYAPKAKTYKPQMAPQKKAG